MSTPSSLAARIDDYTVGPTRVLTLPTSVDDVVSWRGSFLAYPDLTTGDALRQKLAVSLLDKGTERRDRFELARVLEECGAELDLSSDGLYVDVSGRALTEDLPEVMNVLAEMLRRPAFDSDEFEKVRVQAVADTQRRMEKTGAQAASALSRRLFGPGHPNYSMPFEERLQVLQQLSVEDVRAYHDTHMGPDEWTLAVVGDLHPDRVRSVAADAFDGWERTGATPTHETEPADTDTGRTTIPMPDKSNVDVRIGHALPLRRDSDAYPALYVGNYILGGNFSARLMSIVRDKKGLTYQIGSSLSGLSTRYAGSWQVNVTLSRDTLEAGLDATYDVIRRFVQEGATTEELEAKKTTITGSYTVGLATTRHLAQSILTTAERGFSMDYLDQFPRDIEALTLEEVNDAVQTYLCPDQIHEALAGTKPEPVEA